MPATQRAQRSKNSRFQARLKISSENEIFERATHRGPIFCGEIETLRLKFSSEIENFERDWKFRARLNFFDRWALWGFGLPLRFGPRCERPRCQIASDVGRAMRTTKVSMALLAPDSLCQPDLRNLQNLHLENPVTSLNKEVRPFFLGDNSIWSFPSISSLSDYSISRS